VEFYSTSVSKELKGEEETGQHCLDGEMKKVGRWYGSATHAQRRAADGDAQRGSAAGGVAVLMGAGGGRRRPGGLYRAERPSGAERAGFGGSDGETKMG
jgi:hypothetical protein